MRSKKILTIQDISCVGQCSMTVALPILSACGHETCILPSAVLSAHTGGFGKPVVCHMAEIMGEMMDHWRREKIVFDAILVGYLGSTAAVQAVAEHYDSLLAPEGILIVDPAMADHGKLYSGLDTEYARAMENLCRKADMILPNITEAAMFTGVEYRENPTEQYLGTLLEKLDHPCVVLTGAGCRAGETGILAGGKGQRFHYVHPKLEGNYSGTGDMFAASFTGAVMAGKKLEKAVEIAADYVCRCIQHTQQDTDHWYGVRFEPALPSLICAIQE